MKVQWKSILSVVAVVFLGVPGGLAAQASEAGPADPAGADAGLGRWAVARLDSLAERAGVPGAVFSLVSACSTVVRHGTGWADAARREPMDPERTWVRVGSISKVLTATAAVQLAATGAVEPGRPVADYLDGLELDWTYDEPVTLHQLLTHTSGLTDRFTGSGAPRASERLGLAEYFERSLPAQSRRPGEVKIYSSHGIALAGLVVERVSGVPFEDYMDRHLFGPLGMERTSFRIPEGDDRLAVGYRAGGRPISAAYHFHIAPGADAVTTAADMERFLRLQLGCAGSESAPPLDEAGLALMQETHFRNAPDLPGMAYGWEEWWYGGERWLRKPGSAPGFSSVVAIHPERGLGFFLSYNLDMHPLHALFLQSLAERVSGGAATPRPVEAAAAPGDDAVRLTGWYRHLRYDPDSWEKLLRSPLMGGTIRVERAADGTLSIGGLAYESRGGLVWERPNGRGRAAFRAAGDGDAAYLFINGSDGFERLAWYEAPPLHTALLLGSAAIFLVVLVGWVVARLRKRRAAALNAAAAAALLNLAFLVGFGTVFRTTELWDIHYGVPAALSWISPLPLAAAVLAVVAAVRLIRRRRPEPGAAAAFLVAAALAAEAAFAMLLGYWNLFGLIL